MTQKILIAFDDSDNAMRAVDYVAQTFKQDSLVTLFHVLPDTAALCELHSPELTEYFMAQQSNFCALEAKKKKIVQEAMKKAKSSLIHAGFSSESVTLAVNAKKSGVARDIITAATGFSTVVMGRRGLSGIREFFLGSVSQKVFHAAKNVSLVIVN